jgi:enoyl-CoA hydratase
MLAAAMDVVFAAEGTLFLPGLVEYFSVPWDLSPREDKEILMEHHFITAAEALAYGFVNRTYPADQLEAETLGYADRVADNYLTALAKGIKGLYSSRYSSIPKRWISSGVGFPFSFQPRIL